MQRKLTLRVDERVIVRAKAWARRRGVSLSDAVESVLDRLPAREERPLSEWTRSLIGMARRQRRVSPTDAEVRRDHAEHVAARHR
ncbi:MAG TPA: DUF6364 family protein [Vicinamibacteria bacterium]|nr:DUF6364 family protein [Vicinamibacteria bacterium]